MVSCGTSGRERVVGADSGPVAWSPPAAAESKFLSLRPGWLDVKIPDNSVQGRKLRLKGRGLTGKQPGDLYVVLQVALPPADSDAAKALYRQMRDQLGFNPRTRLGVS